MAIGITSSRDGCPSGCFLHNTETVPSLYRRMRSKGKYDRCLELASPFRRISKRDRCGDDHEDGIMCGLGEEPEEILAVMDDLRQVECDVLTLGQYLNPTKKHAPVACFYTPEEFDDLKLEALKRGFKHVVSGPLVRSSYHAHEHVPGESRIKKGGFRSRLFYFLFGYYRPSTTPRLGRSSHHSLVDRGCMTRLISTYQGYGSNAGGAYGVDIIAHKDTSSDISVIPPVI